MKDVHTEHCCARHGCKYGDEDCPVELGLKKQSYLCEWCSEEIEQPLQRRYVTEGFSFETPHKVKYFVENDVWQRVYLGCFEYPTVEELDLLNTLFGIIERPTP